MATLALYSQPVTGVAVSAQGTPNMTVAVAAGTVLVQNVEANVTAGNVTITAADTLNDRIDAIVSDSSGNLSAIAGTVVSDGQLVQDPTVDPTLYCLLAYVYVVNQSAPSYTGTIVSTAITSNPLGYVQMPEPGQTFAMTFLSAAWTSGDPGTGNIQFDTTNWNTIAHLYANYTSASAPQSIKTWFQNNGIVGSPAIYYLRIWSRKDPSKWITVQVSTFTDHSTYCDLAITAIQQSSATSSIPLSTDALDTIIEFAGAVPPSAPVSSVFGRTGAVVAVAGDYAGCLLGIRNILNGTTSYTPTAGTNTAYVECQAGGGACVTGTLTTNVSGGGGGGGYSASKITTVGSGAHTVAVGAGGAAGAHDGGDTSYTKTGTDGGTAPLAKGGSQGASASTTSSAGGLGGASGSGTGDITADGGGGGPGFFSSSTVNSGGAGGNTFFGSGGQAGKAGTAGTAGGLYGGGAGGAGSASTSSQPGGNGLLRITEYT